MISCSVRFQNSALHFGEHRESRRQARRDQRQEGRPLPERYFQDRASILPWDGDAGTDRGRCQNPKRVREEVSKKGTRCRRKQVMCCVGHRTCEGRTAVARNRDVRVRQVPWHSDRHRGRYCRAVHRASRSQDRTVQLRLLRSGRGATSGIGVPPRSCPLPRASEPGTETGSRHRRLPRRRS